MENPKFCRKTMENPKFCRKTMENPIDREGGLILMASISHYGRIIVCRMPWDVFKMNPEDRISETNLGVLPVVLFILQLIFY